MGVIRELFTYSSFPGRLPVQRWAAEYGQELSLYMHFFAWPGSGNAPKRWIKILMFLLFILSIPGLVIQIQYLIKQYLKHDKNTMLKVSVT